MSSLSGLESLLPANYKECWMRPPEWSVARGSSTVVWHSYYTGLTCLSASSTNSAWWCADARTALLRSIWQHTGHQSLRLRHDIIFARLPAINWQFRHIDGSHMMVGRSLSPVRRRGTHCRNVYTTLPAALLCLAVLSKHFSSRSTNICSSLKVLARMRYINWRFTFHYITALWVATDACWWYRWCKAYGNHFCIPSGPCCYVIFV